MELVTVLAELNTKLMAFYRTKYKSLANTLHSS